MPANFPAILYFFHGFIQTMPDHKGFDLPVLEQFTRVNEIKHGAIVANYYPLFETVKDMTASIISNYPFLRCTNHIYNGVEHWNIRLPRSISRELKQDLTDVASILSWNSDYSSKGILTIGPQFTEVEYNTLRRAEKLGYFEYPRNADLMALSDSLGVSKQAASVTLRRAICKLVKEKLNNET